MLSSFESYLIENYNEFNLVQSYMLGRRKEPLSIYIVFFVLAKNIGRILQLMPRKNYNANSKKNRTLLNIYIGKYTT